MRTPESDASHYRHNRSYNYVHTETDWLLFKQKFETDHCGYLSRLQQQYPSLNESEIRFLIMTELDMSDRNIAESLGVSIDFVKRELFSLCKKLRVQCSELKNIAHSV